MSIRIGDNRGQSLVEFGVSATVLLPLVIAILLGFIDIGRMVLLYTTVSNAARAGTRYAIVHGTDASPSSGPADDDPAVISAVKASAGVGGLNVSALQVHVYYYSAGGVAPGCNLPGCWVKVTASYPYDKIISYFPLNPTLGSSSEGVITF